MGKIKCPNCVYESDTWSVKRHFERKHKERSKFFQHASKPHPYVHPYINNNNQQTTSDFLPRTPEMVANNTYYAMDTRAPTKISVGPNGPRASTTISVPPQIGGVQGGSGIGGQFHRPSHNSFDGTINDKNNRAPTTYHEPGAVVRAPTKIYVPAVQHGDGINIDDEEDSDEDMDTEEESDIEDEDEEDKDTDVYDVLLDISRTFNYLQELRKQYRDLLPQVKEMGKEDLDSFLQAYSLLKTNIIEEQDGLEGTVFKKQHGKGVTESDDNADEETDNEDNDADTEDGDETDEETVDSEEDEQAEDLDVEFDDIVEDDPNKEPFFNFVFEAEHFLDTKSKEKLEEYFACDKKDHKLDHGCDQDETNIPTSVGEIVEDMEDVLDKWNEKEEECFKECSKRKIVTTCSMAHHWMDATSLQKMKKRNPSKYRFLKRMLKPHMKSLEKLVSSDVSIHEKRKTLQKAQVGEGILQTASHLILPLLRKALKI